MTPSIELYQQFLLKTNKNDTNSNIKIPKSKFVLIFNEQQRKYVDEYQKNNNNTDSILGIKELFVENFQLQKVKTESNREYFKLPDDFDKYENSYSIAKKGDCESVIYNWELKTKNITTVLQDENNNPSFEYQETPVVLSGNNLVVYKDDFQVDKVFLNYYKEPVEIDIEGYTKIDESPSKTINPILSKTDLDKIVDLCVLEISRTYQDANNYQLNQTRINN